jgi:transposase
VVIAEQAAAIAELAAKVGRLERLVSRNSGNSSFPPSLDAQPGRTRPKPKRRRADGSRKPGKQPGAPGSFLAWSARPDERVRWFPPGRCRCGAGLAGGCDLGVVASHQQVEIPLVAARVIQHDRHAVACGCGRVHLAPPPPGAGAPGTVTYGPNLQAWCVYLMAAHAVPVHRCAGLVESLTGAAPSPGFVHGLLARAAAAVKPVNMLIRALVIAAPAVCCDETPVRAGPGPAWHKRWLLVAATPLLTYYTVAAGRSVASFAQFVLPDLAGVVVHDRYLGYDHPKTGIGAHQLCCAHLLRDLEDAAQTYPDATWPIQLTAALTGLIHAANQARAHGLAAVPAATAAPLITAYRQAITAGLADLATRPGGTRRHHRHHRQRLLDDLRDREADVLRFTTDTRIPPTSNQAERDLRPAKTQEKISGRLRCEHTTSHRYAIRGYLSTATKHHTDALTALRNALTGNPWMPPIPDTL